MNISNIRNFCIIAHIDHGKSTLADRMIEFTKTLMTRDMRDQILDSMDIERERGITVKLQTVHMLWQDEAGETWQYDLVDTPGQGVEALLCAIPRIFPQPDTQKDGALRAFVFESHYDSYRGAILHVRMVDGMLLREIIEERLKREYRLEVITTAPAVTYRCRLKNHSTVVIDNPALFPAHDMLLYVEEPFMHTHLTTRSAYAGRVLELCEKQRGSYIDMTYLSAGEVLIEYSMPLSMMIDGFFSDLKSASQGYATLDYQPDGYRQSELVRIDIHIDAQPVDALTFISYTATAFDRGTAVVHKLKHLMPRRLYPVPVQAIVNHKSIARVDIPPLRKNMLASGFNGSVSAKQ